jgi:DNA-binding Xre family transcriptional regulator
VRRKLKEDLARFMRESRGRATLSQFGRKLGISDSTLQRIEVCQQNVTLDTLEQIIKRLGCKITDIFK